jgi:hypothetical protein
MHPATRAISIGGAAMHPSSYDSTVMCAMKVCFHRKALRLRLSACCKDRWLQKHEVFERRPYDPAYDAMVKKALGLRGGFAERA